MLTVEQLTNLRLGTLKTAVTDWDHMVRKLRELATGQGGGGDVTAAQLKSRTESANWNGINATVGKSFVSKTASEFDDVVTEAESVRAILRDAHDAFTKHKSDLKTAIDDAAKSSIYISGKGEAHSAVPSGAAAGADDKIHKPTASELEAAQDRVKRILWEAHEDDRIAARALRGYAKHGYDFSDQGVGGLKDADRKQGEADAEYWAKKIREGDVKDWSDADLRRYNSALKDQRDNPGFAEKFATELGAKGTLQFWRDLAAPPGGALEGDRAKILQDVQDNLGMTLATASHGNSQAMQDWKHDFIAAGSKPFPIEGLPMGPYGFQVGSSLMRKGEFDSKFMNNYGDAMLKFEREYPGDPDVLWRDTTSLDYPPIEGPNDPVSGFMEGLGYNPKASLEFFGGSTGEGDDKLSNWDYLVGHEKNARAWPAGEDGKPAGYKYLGHALESATLGYACDDKDPHVPLLKTEAQIEAREARMDLVSKVVQNYNSADVIDKQPGIGDSLANIAAGHIDSINYSSADFGGSASANGRDDRFGADERHLRDLGPTSTKNFLSALAGDEDSYNTVSAAQQAYGSSLMVAQGDDDADVKRVAMFSIKMHGMLDQARFESIGNEYGEAKDAANRELEKQGAWRDFFTGAAVGTTVGVASELILPTHAAAAIAVPLAFEVMGGAAETAAGNETLDWLKENEFENRDEAISSIDKAKQSGQHNAMTPLLNYGEKQGLSEDDMWDLAEEAEGEYNKGAARSDTDDARGF
ncbi:hypothetical protein ACFVDQ_16330 [Streptomyces sp. NPDC057684]|uniref:hypothetical protein n=1 Tax=Streptomyces sp. NPDC057684 TaxID=3346211 RepID=UPI0036852C03